jgi:lipopolysaccharide/colanic/teichoic acid biosynthesis glycosyltransferase
MPRQEARLASKQAVKRGIDIAGALVGMLLFAPTIAVFGALVWLESRGPVFCKRRCIGTDGRPFDIYQIRSSRIDAEGYSGRRLRGDPGLLKVGSFMREWNLDDLPQFINVLRGEMSLVGSRPEDPEWIGEPMEGTPCHELRNSFKPGITGWAQVNGSRSGNCQRERMKFDLDYIGNWSLILDFRILAMTLFGRKGAR